MTNKINKKNGLEKETLNSEELIYQLVSLCSDRKFKKRHPLPKFTLKEALFIRDLIFLKPPDIVYFYIADHMVRRSEIGAGLFNRRSYRRYLFLINYLEHKGNATNAAIASGYSPKSAKQQGHRILKHIQSYFQNERDDDF